MKKKILSFALSGMLAITAAFGLAACKPQNGTGGTNNNGGNSGNGGTNNGGNSNTNSGQTIAPGTVITDETLKNSVFSALAEAEIEGFSYSGGLTISATQGADTTTQTVELEGAAVFGENVQADVCLSVESDDGLLYLLGFLRADGLYSATGEEESDEVDFTALKTQLKAETDPLILEKNETGPLQSILAAPATVKLVKNMTSLVDGVVTKTEGGYSLSFDLVSGVTNLLKGAGAVADAIDNTADLTLSALFSQKFVDDTLSSLLNGITAAELKDFIELLPQEMQTVLPQPQSGTAKDYLLGLLRSGSFYTEVAGEGEPWTNYRTFGEVPLATLVSAVSGGEIDLASVKLKEMLENFGSTLENQIVSLLAEIISVDGTVTEENVDLSVSFSFDENKKLLGIALDALAEGNVSPAAEEQPQPDGGHSPEDGNGDEMNVAAESGAKVRFGLKLSATCAQSPELFDLKGCKYRGDEGPVAIK